MENDDSWVVHGFSYNDYLSELGANAQSLVFNVSSPLDKAFNNTFYNARKFLMSAFNLTEDNAHTAMTVRIPQWWRCTNTPEEGVVSAEPSIPEYTSNESKTANLMPSTPDCDMVIEKAVMWAP
jgi:hypothetical protein